MTNEEARDILIHYDDYVYQQNHHITCGMIADALNMATEALTPWRKFSEQKPEEGDKIIIAILEGKDLAIGAIIYNEFHATKWWVGSDKTERYWMLIPELPKED